jgi:hypothetical protein
MRRLIVEIAIAVLIAVWCTTQFKSLAVSQSPVDSSWVGAWAGSSRAGSVRNPTWRRSADGASIAQPRRRVTHTHTPMPAAPAWPGSVFGVTFVPHEAPDGTKITARDAQADSIHFTDSDTVQWDNKGVRRELHLEGGDTRNLILTEGPSVYEAFYDSTTGQLIWQGRVYAVKR